MPRVYRWLFAISVIFVGLGFVALAIFGCAALMGAPDSVGRILYLTTLALLGFGLMPNIAATMLAMLDYGLGIERTRNAN